MRSSPTGSSDSPLKRRRPASELNPVRVPGSNVPAGAMNPGSSVKSGTPVAPKSAEKTRFATRPLAVSIDAERYAVRSAVGFALQGATLPDRACCSMPVPSVMRIR